ncbi:MAG TPA: response regulator [Terriglobales bacterium]|jgi:chemotaxis response regulator CheB|nr:response regulator [Terriglobales bacterium]
MAIRVLMADDNDAMRSAIRRTLNEEPRIEIVAEASTFAETIQMISDFKPAVLLLDLHLPERREITPALVKAQLRRVCTLAVSLSNDAEAKALAESYGAVSLLDKMNLYREMIPAIMQFSDNPA